MVKSMNVVTLLGLAAMVVADISMDVPSSYEPVIPIEPPMEYPPMMPTGSVDEPTSSCETDEVAPTEHPTVHEAYTSTWTSQEVYPTVCTSDSGEVYTTETSSVHYYTSICETPEASPVPTTITTSYETTLESCITYPTIYTSEGTVCTTETSSTQTITSTHTATNTYTPEHPAYTHPVVKTSKVPAPPAETPHYPVETPYYPTGAIPTPMGTAVPTGMPHPPKNHTNYVPPAVTEANSGSMNGIPMIAGLSAVFGAALLLL